MFAEADWGNKEADIKRAVRHGRFKLHYDRLTEKAELYDLQADPGEQVDIAETETATLERLRELYPEGRFETRRFRPNIVVEPASDEKAFIEDAWIGQSVSIGDEVRLAITEPCPRCVMTTLPQGDLPRDRGILRTASQHNQVHVGVYAKVLQGGTIHRGDQVTVG